MFSHPRIHPIFRTSFTIHTILLVVLLAGFPALGLPQPSGQIAHYPLNGNAIDTGPNGWNGTVIGAQSSADRWNGSNQAVRFSSSGDHIVLPPGIIGMTSGVERTIAMWVKPDFISPQPDNAGLVSQYVHGYVAVSNFFIALERISGVPVLNIAGNGTSRLDLPLAYDPTGEWIHIAVVMKAGANNTRAYLNGFLLGTGTVTYNSVMSSESPIIGTVVGGMNNDDFRGSIDEVRFFSRALSDAEIIDVVRLGNRATGLIGYYPFNGSANDESWNGHSGTVTDAALTTDRFGRMGRAYAFNGSHSKIDCGDFGLPVNQFSISAWFTVSSVYTSTLEYIAGDAGMYQGFRIWHQYDSIYFQTQWGSGGYGFGQEIAFGLAQSDRDRWIHVVGTSSNGTLHLYRDGGLMGTSVDQPADEQTFGVHMGLGYEPFLDNYPWNGKLDDIRFYDRVLTQQGVDSLLSEGGWSVPLKGLSAHFALDGNLADSSGYGTSAVARGSLAWVPDRFGKDNASCALNGVDAFISTGALQNVRTLAFWLKPGIALSSTTPVWAPVLNDYGNQFLILGGQTDSRWPDELINMHDFRNTANYYWTATQLGISTIDTAWHHMVFRWDEALGVYQLYLDGTLRPGPGVEGSPRILDLDTCAIGAYENQRYFGRLDDMRFHQTSLSPEQILDLYRAGGWSKLSIASVSPGRLAANVARGTQIAISFSSPVQTSSAGSDKVRVRGSLSGTHACVQSWNPAGTELTLNPTTDFLPGEHVSVTLSASIRRAMSPDSLPGGYQWQFTIGGLAASPGTLLSPVKGTAASGAYFVTPVDLDQNGAPDFVSNSATGVEVHMNTGSGAPAMTRHLTLNHYVVTVDAGDMDNDGDPDIVATNGENPDAVRVLWNDGTGVLGLKSTTAMVDFGGTPAVGDFDGDGDLDVVACVNYYAPGIQPMRNDGSGVLTSAATISMWTPSSAKLADLDNDGDLDIVAALARSPLNIVTLRNNGTGVFTVWTTLTYSDSLVGNSLRCGDLDGDGNMDAVCLAGPECLAVLRGDGNGSFSSKTIYAITPGSEGLAGLALADMDGDGDLDVIASNSVLGSVSVSKNDGAGNLDPPTFISGVTKAQGLAVADFTGDNVLDVVAMGSQTGEFALLAGATNALQILLQPKHRTVTVGDTVSFTVAASGTPPFMYQWQKNGSDISGAIADRYVTPPVEMTDNGNRYRCRIRNAQSSVLSEEAVLTVNALAAKIVLHPAPRTVQVGDTVHLSVVATGTGPLGYQWQRNSTDISGGDEALLVLPPVALANNGERYRCIVRNVLGRDTSTTVPLTVVAVPAQILVHPVTVTGISEGDSVRFWVRAEGSPPLTYQWQRESSDLSGATDDTLRFKAVPADIGAGFRCIVTNSVRNDTSNIAIVEPLLRLPILLAPGTGSSNNPVACVLRWSSVGTGASYHVQVSARDFISSLDVDTTTADTALAVTLNRGNTYVWRVQATYGGRTTAYSPTGSFGTVPHVPRAPRIITPASGTPNLTPGAVRIAWDTCGSATDYALEVALDPGFRNRIVRDSNLAVPINTTSVSRDVVSLAYNSTYYARASAHGAGGTGSWSEVCTFSTQPLNTYQPTLVQVFPATPASSKDYRLVSFPGISARTLGDILSGPSPADWRMFRDNGNPIPTHLTELSPASTIAAGEGYWLLRKGAMTWEGETLMPMLDTAGCFSIPLRPGFNIIGNPFDRDIAWQLVRDRNPGLQSFAIISTWDASGFRQDTTLRVWKGVYLDNPNGLTSLRLPYPFPGRGTTFFKQPRLIWTLSLTLESGENRDDNAIVGVAEGADDALDDLDVRKPPGFSTQPSLGFRRPLWKAGTSLFARDIQPVHEDGHVWTFDVDQPVQGEARLRIDGLAGIPDRFEARLVNLANSTPVDLRTTSVYVYTPVKPTMSFLLVVGRRAYVEQEIARHLPAEFSLSDNYPNPFNPVTWISYTVPRTADIRIEVFSVLGQQMETLASGVHEPGMFTVRWDPVKGRGGAAASGTYYCRMLVNGRPMAIQKMLYLK